MFEQWGLFLLCQEPVLFLEAFKARLDRVWRNLVSWEVSLPIAGELQLDRRKGQLQAKPFSDFRVAPEGSVA